MYSDRDRVRDERDTYIPMIVRTSILVSPRAVHLMCVMTDPLRGLRTRCPSVGVAARARLGGCAPSEFSRLTVTCIF